MLASRGGLKPDSRFSFSRLASSFREFHADPGRLTLNFSVTHRDRKRELCFKAFD